MAHKYFCTHCGRELNQDNVLFDLQHVLTGDSRERFDILSFRLTKEELDRLITTGKRGDLNYVHYELSFAEFLQFVSNGNNLNDPAIQSLTMEQITSFLEELKKKEYGEEQFDEDEEDDELDSLFGGLGDDEEEDDLSSDIAAEADNWPEAIKVLRAKDTTNKRLEETQNMLRRDLTILKNIFGASGSYRMEFLPLEEDDDHHMKVLYGYRSNAGTARRNTTVKSARMCRYCGRPVFDHAGTAEHRTVAFIGDQSSGKTSTILAMAHYAYSAMRGAVSTDPIWGKSKALGAVQDVELISPDDRLRHDLEKYEEGIAPPKTSASRREDAYSATFRVKNRAQADKYYILTLTDLPGELCDPNSGEIDIDNIMNNFPVALACEMFILCFDATTAVGSKVTRMVDNVCKWANQFQGARAEYWRNAVTDSSKNAGEEGCYAPVMILYTKCPELENAGPADPNKRRRRSADRIAESYIFNSERMEINENEIYNLAGSRFKEYDNLKNVFLARLRCSPFGYAAPGELEVQKGAEHHSPTPIHIDGLMKWVLSVTGCIDTEAVFRPDLTDASTRFTVPGNFIVRPQYRIQKPAGEGRNGDLNEALARCYLFENPGAVDRSLLEVYDNSARLAQARFKAALAKNNG